MRLLVVEDEPYLLETLARELRDEGYAVDTADNGTDGLTKALDTDYDTVVLDVMMPGLDGWQVLERLRLEKSDTPVLMLTARDAVPDRVKGLEIGADDYLTKPCDLSELFARVRSLIRRSQDQPNPHIEIGDLLVDTAARAVSRDGERIDLTPREYAMLEFFVYRRGEVVSRTMLYDHLFDEDESSLSNLLDVHVCRLRKKLGSDLIKTRRGMGYCLDA